ncbi:hypothetical protein D3C78_1886520 [compost metagenome]
MHRNLDQHVDLWFCCESGYGCASDMMDGDKLRAKRFCDLLFGGEEERRPPTVIERNLAR